MTPPMTDRTLPRPWGLCDGCGEAAGLPLPGRADYHLCAVCAAHDALRKAAQDDLEALASPAVGAWAAQWGAAGLSGEELREITEQLSGAWMAEDYGKAYRLAHLRRLRRAHRAPAFEVAGPDRVAFHAEALPMLAAYRPADPERGILWPYFLDTHGEARTIHPGPDTLTLIQPDGGRVLIFTGSGGQTAWGSPAYTVPGFRVPAHLWPHVEAVLSRKGGPQEGGEA
ncbi:hypothetical protein QOL99_02985 [Deinococcus sp. MIMF12]|uniref:Uncharacterized protein n=1 Tax=Deinococcus rhizophilus TaxID=3049544 RepID=A0ABT7JDI7_9DEIO|nr:hypothetical protein [Deinococcus rhizophilus]MDL2343110.1 hypothetical protein [Deinococcus rhizophilus]